MLAASQEHWRKVQAFSRKALAGASVWLRDQGLLFGELCGFASLQGSGAGGDLGLSYGGQRGPSGPLWGVWQAYDGVGSRRALGLAFFVNPLLSTRQGVSALPVCTRVLLFIDKPRLHLEKVPNLRRFWVFHTCSLQRGFAACRRVAFGKPRGEQQIAVHCSFWKEGCCRLHLEPALCSAAASCGPARLWGQLSLCTVNFLTDSGRRSPWPEMQSGTLGKTCVGLEREWVTLRSGFVSWGETCI